MKKQRVINLLRELLIASFVLLLLSVGCSRVEERGSEIGEIGETTFSAQYKAAPLTKSPSPFGGGKKVAIYGYSAGDTPASGTVVTPAKYIATANSGGVLSPPTPLYLPKGSYNFYSISFNSTTEPLIAFTNEVSEKLSNSVDYLWAKVENITAGGNVNFTFKHIATALEIELVGGAGVTNFEATSIEVSLPKITAANTLNLANGEITPSTALENATAIPLNSNIGKVIMLPIDEAILTINVVANLTIGEVNSVGKQFTATLPKESYIGGSYYKVTLNVEPNKITFGSATVLPWNEKSVDSVVLEEL